MTILEEQGRAARGDLRKAHAKRHTNPEFVVVFCVPGDAGGYPYANQRYKPIAEAFALEAGGEVANWDSSNCFTVGPSKFQVVSDRTCIDVISRD